MSASRDSGNRSFQAPGQTSKKPYQKPEVVHELRLEVQAGSPLRKLPDPLDLLGTGPHS